MRENIAEAKAVIVRARTPSGNGPSTRRLEARAEKAEKTGRKPGGRPPEPPVPGRPCTPARARPKAYNARRAAALLVTNDEPALEALRRPSFGDFSTCRSRR